MKYIEYGKENKDAIILLHGGGLSWWNYEEVAKLLEKDYRIILPILDGHSGSDRAFTSIEDNAEEIIDFVDNNFKGHVLLIGGLSLGGQILLEILSRRKDICSFAIVESALVIPSKATYYMIEPAFGSCYGLIKHRWFSKLQFKSLKIKPDFFDRYYRDTCAISKSDMIAFLQSNSLYSLKESIKECRAKIYVFVGKKENSAMKKSAKTIQQTINTSKLQILTGLYHGEFSINRSDDYARKIREIISE